MPPTYPGSLVESGGERRPERAVARIAIEDEHHHLRVCRRRRREPAVQAQAIGRDKRDCSRAWQNSVDRRDVLRQRKVDQTALKEPERSQQQSKYGGNHPDSTYPRAPL
jgi:hypothetical protein